MSSTTRSPTRSRTRPTDAAGHYSPGCGSTRSRSRSRTSPCRRVLPRLRTDPDRRWGRPTRASSARTATRRSRSSSPAVRCPSGRRRPSTSSATISTPESPSSKGWGYAFEHGPVDQRWLLEEARARSGRARDLPLPRGREPSRPAPGCSGGHMKRDRWNEKWRERGAGAIGAEPLPGRGGIRELSAGRALDLACGAGRNAIWLAERGWRVTAVDYSEVGLAEARADVRRTATSTSTGSSPTSQTGRLPAPPSISSVLYLQLPAGERRLVLDRAAGAGAGGTMLVVGHDLTNLTDGYAGPTSADVLYTPDDLVADLAGLAVERAERVIRPVEDEDGLHEAIDALVRARRLTSRARGDALHRAVQRLRVLEGEVVTAESPHRAGRPRDRPSDRRPVGWSGSRRWARTCCSRSRAISSFAATAQKGPLARARGGRGRGRIALARAARRAPSSRALARPGARACPRQAADGARRASGLTSWPTRRGVDPMIGRLRSPISRGRSATRCSTSGSLPGSGTCGRRRPSSTWRRPRGDDSGS